MNRRTLLLGVGAGTTGAAAVFGSGAFTQMKADRELSIGVDSDSQALLGLVANPDLDSVYEQNGQLTIDSNQLSGSNSGFNVAATVELGATDGSGAVIAGDEAFRIRNNFDQNIHVEIDLSDSDLANSPSTISLIATRTDNDATKRVDAGPNATLDFEGFESGAEILVAIHIQTEASQNPEDIQGQIVFRADPSALQGAPQPTFTILNEDTGVTYNVLDTAIQDANAGETLAVGPSNSSYTLTQPVDVTNLTIEGPNVGVAGDSDDRASEAIVESGGSTWTVNVSASGVEIAGFEIRNPSGSGDGDTSINAQGIRVDPDATDVTLRDNRITDIGTQSNTNSRGIIAFSGADNLSIKNNELSKIDGTSTNEAQVEAIQVIEQGGAGQTPSVENVLIEGNSFSNISDERSPVAIRLNGNVDGEVLNNQISGLQRGATQGFTVGIALAEGGNATSPPHDVLIRGNEISDLGPTVTNDEVPPIHVFLASADGNTVTIEDNQLTGETDIFVGDTTNQLDIQSILNTNSFDPGGYAASLNLGGTQGQAIIADGPLKVVNIDQLSTYETIPTALADAAQGDRLIVAPGTYDGFEVGTNDVTITAVNGPSETAIQGVDAVGPDSAVEGIRVNATGVTIDGFRFAGQSGENDRGVVVSQNGGGTVTNAVFDGLFAGVDIESGIVDATITNNDFVGDGNTDRYVEDFGSSQVDLSAILNSQGNAFNPAGTIDTGTRIIPQ